ncbi:MAG: AgmX/PglI C-terminal domain-containing protein [Deltaproteobacteria bacterium]|nr:AgmX/PglI C-terminal domain-containing protein [Deltaproteobacteria bacterium]MCW5802649.1 AgmX/PglI C-terminal domain-containing protein [Deltaproteobacteria bacterium]
MTQLALRTTLIWHDEVMDDVILETPKPITLGRTGRCTFTIPEVGLPQEFAIVRPGNRGYLLTLGERMRGTIHVDGETKDVAEFVARGEGEDLGGGAGGFRATPIGDKDWGVIDLDESGHYKLYFQFVPIAPSQLTPHADTLSTLMMTGALAVVAQLAFMVLASELSLIQDNAIFEWVFRSICLIPASLFVYGLGFSLLHDNVDSQASYGFSAMLHGALLAYVVTTWPKKNPYKYPGDAATNASYLVSRIQPETPPPPPPVVPAIVTKDKAKKDGTEVTKEKAKEKQMTATVGAEGQSGGKGDKERSRRPDAKDEVVKDVMGAKAVEAINNVMDRDTKALTERFLNGKFFNGTSGFGDSEGTGVGNERAGFGTRTDGNKKGPGGGGKFHGDLKTSGKPLDTGPNRPQGDCTGPGCTGGKPKEVAVSIGGGTGDFNGYTEDEIRRVVSRSAGLFKACYQKELNRTPGLAGNLTVFWKIGPEGTVLSAARTGGTLANAAVEGCVKAFVMKLKFPPKGVTANVTYPFVFTQGG